MLHWRVHSEPAGMDGTTPEAGSPESMPAFQMLADRVGSDKALLVATKLMVCDADDFHKYDADRSGMISQWEFTAMFRNVSDHAEPRSLSQARVDDMRCAQSAVDVCPQKGALRRRPRFRVEGDGQRQIGKHLTHGGAVGPSPRMT